MTATAARSARVRSFALAAAIGVALLVLWGWGLFRFAAAIPDTVADPRTSTDAIVVLTGGSERLATGVALLARDLAGRAFVSGVHPDVETEEVLRNAGGVPADLVERIETGHGARDTVGNARETAAWMRRHDFHSLRLVTASYHMPRSLLEFDQMLPDATIIPNPVFPTHVKQARWWAWPGTAALIIGEYNKFLLSSARHRLVALVGAGPARETAGPVQ